MKQQIIFRLVKQNEDVLSQKIIDLIIKDRFEIELV